MAAGTVVCVACGYNRKTKKVEKPAEAEGPDEAESAQPLTWKQRWAVEGLDGFKDWEIPIALIAASFLFITVAHLFTAPILDLPKVLFVVAVLALAEAGWIYAGMCVMELLTQIEYGDWRTAMLKLCAITSFWFALGVLFEWQAPNSGWLAHAAVGWPVEFLLIWWLFNLEALWAIGTMIAVALTQMIVSAIMPG